MYMEVYNVYQDRIVLTAKDILEKEFKIDTRGYRPQEVDKFLDLVIKDYGGYNSLLREKDRENKELLEENMQLKQELRTLKTKLDAIEESSSSGGNVNNVDLLRRLSNLEKIVYGKEEKE